MRNAFKPTDPPWNATADGVTDDTCAIRDCLLAAQSAHVDVYLPSATYLVQGTLTIPGGVALIGDGMDQDGTTLLHAPTSAGTNLLEIDGDGTEQKGRDIQISGLCLKSGLEGYNTSKHALHAYRAARLRVKDVRIVQHSDVSRPWQVGVWLETGLQNEFYNLQVEDCSQACLYFYYQEGQGQSTTQLFQNCRFRQGWRGVIAQDRALITTRFIGCTVEDCSVAAVQTLGACEMTWIDPHVEGVPVGGGAYTIFDLGPGSVVNVYGGRLGGYSGEPHPDSSIFCVNEAKSINLNGVTLHKAGTIFDVHAPPAQLTMSGVVNESVGGIGELTGVRSLHISGCML